MEGGIRGRESSIGEAGLSEKHIKKQANTPTNTHGQSPLPLTTLGTTHPDEIIASIRCRKGGNSIPLERPTGYYWPPTSHPTEYQPGDDSPDFLCERPSGGEARYKRGGSRGKVRIACALTPASGPSASQGLPQENSRYAHGLSHKGQLPKPSPARSERTRSG